MGQRSQVYIRYKNKKNLVAYHLQWNYGHYMVNRTYQLLDYIQKNVNTTYSHFKEEDFDIANDGKKRSDLNILSSLIQLNMTMGSFVGGIDLVKEEYDYSDEDNRLTFKMSPLRQHNNNGILVIDVAEDDKIKYGLAGGYEETDNFDYFRMVGAKRYLEMGDEQCSDDKYRLVNTLSKELYDEVQRQADYIDNNFELLTQEEYDEIFDTEYRYEDCLKESDI